MIIINLLVINNMDNNGKSHLRQTKQVRIALRSLYQTNFFVIFIHGFGKLTRALPAAAITCCTLGTVASAADTAVVVCTSGAAHSLVAAYLRINVLSIKQSCKPVKLTQFSHL